MTTTIPHERQRYEDTNGEVILLEKPCAFHPRVEVWMTRAAWDQWCRFSATDELIEAQDLFRKAITHL